MGLGLRHAQEGCSSLCACLLVRGSSDLAVAAFPLSPVWLQRERTLLELAGYLLCSRRQPAQNWWLSHHE